MTHLARFFLFCLVVGWLSACAAAPDQSVVDPTVTVTALLPLPLPSPTAVPPPTETDGPHQRVAVADARFFVHRLAAVAAPIAIADFDNDGRLDLVSGGEPELTLFRGDGQGGLVPSGQVPGGQEPTGFALADLDGDGDVDIVVANHNTTHLTILLGDGRGQFQPAPNSPLPIDVDPHPHAVHAADLDADGVVDLLIDHRNGEGVLVLTGAGGGQFETPGTLVAVGGDPYRGLALGDLNGDGRPDLVTPNPDEAAVLLHAGGPGIAFEPAPPVAAMAPFAVALGEFNGDGRLDLLTAADEGSALVELFLGDGRGGFDAAPDSPYQLAPGGKEIVVADFNGDGVDDAVVASYHATEILVLLGGPGAMKVSPLPVPGAEHPWGLAAADLNGDGRDDLVVADDGTGTAVVFLSREG